MNVEKNGIRYCFTNKPVESAEEVSDEVYKRLSGFIGEEPALLATEPLPLQWSFEDGLAVIAFDGDDPVGYTRIHPLLADQHPAGGWWELGTTWVHPDARGRGINKGMYDWLLPRHAGKNILATSINPASISVGLQMHFVHIHRKDLPEVVWRSSCTCPFSKTGCSNGNVGCKLAWEEPQQTTDAPCFFRVTRETATRLGLLH